MSRSETSWVDIGATERQAQAVSLRKPQPDGRRLTLEQIGRELGITKQSAHALIRNAINAVRDGIADDVRAIFAYELAALAAAQEPALRVLLHPDDHTLDDQIKAAHLLVRVSESRRKLVGADAPERLVLEPGLPDPTPADVPPDPAAHLPGADLLAQARKALEEARAA